MNRNLRSTLAIFISFLVAVALIIIPVPNWANWFRPLWVLMLLSYWSLALDNYNGLSEAFFAGILLDVLSGTFFGEHAFALVITIALVLRFKQKIRMYTFTQQALFFLVLSFIYQMMIYIIEGVTRHQSQTLLFWGTLITTPLLWPWVFILLRDYRRRFRVT